MVNRKLLSNKSVIVVAVLITLISILRETGLITIDLFHSEFKTGLTHSIRNNSTVVTIDKNQLRTDFGSMYPSDMAIVIIYNGDTLFREPKTAPLVYLYITNISYGKIWVPMFKSTDFSAEIDVEANQPLTSTVGNRLSVTQLHLSGNMIIDGHAQIIGVCSNRNSTRLIKNIIAKEAVNCFRSYLNSLD
jgi:hypothetical protein